MTARSYVYGVVAAGPLRAPPRGVHEAPVRLVDDDRVAAVVSDVEAPPHGTRRELLAHFSVVEDIAGDRTILPVRFGTLFRSDRDVRESLLRPRVDRLRRLLGEMAGYVELTLKAAYREDVVLGEIVEERRGVRRLRARTAERSPDASYFDRIELGEQVVAALAKKRTLDGAAILDRLAGLAERVEVGEPTGDYGVVRASFLVARDDVPRFDRSVADLDEDMGWRIRFRYAGPLPPYSFVSLDDLQPAGRSG